MTPQSLLTMLPPSDDLPSSSSCELGALGSSSESGSESELLATFGRFSGEDTGSATTSARIVCLHADRCGGCPLIALPYGEQLAMKRGRVVQSASHYPTLELVYTEPVTAADPIVEYRTRAKLNALGKVVKPDLSAQLLAQGAGAKRP